MANLRNLWTCPLVVLVDGGGSDPDHEMHNAGMVLEVPLLPLPTPWIYMIKELRTSSYQPDKILFLHQGT